MEDLARVDQCKAEIVASDHRREEIPGIVDRARDELQDRGML